MKHAMQIIGLSMLVMVIFVGIISLQSKHHKEKEASESLNLAINDAIEELSESKISTYTSDKELVAAFEQLLLSKYSVSGISDGGTTIEGDPNFSLKVSVADSSHQDGMIAIKVKETFTYPNNKIGEIEDIAMITFDEEYKKDTYSIRFENSDATIKEVTKSNDGEAIQKLIKQYTVEEEQKVIVPNASIKIATFRKNSVNPKGTVTYNTKTATTWLVTSSDDTHIPVGASYTTNQLKNLVVGKDILGDITLEAIYN